MEKNKLDRNEMARRAVDRTRKISSNFSIFQDYFIRFFRFLSSIIDNFVFSHKYLGISSLLLSLLFYFLLGIDENSITKALTSSKTLSSVNIVTRYNSEIFEVTGVPSKCDVIVTGDAANVSNSTANKNGYCLLDLEGYTEGTHYVRITAFGYGDGVNATAVPSNAQIVLKRKTTAQFKLSYDYINLNQLDQKYTLSNPVFNNGVDYVNVRASQDTLNSIALVKVLIDVKGKTSNFTVDAPLVAYNSRGQQVEAEIVPSTVSVSVNISSFQKTVPITLKLIGDTPAGIAVDSISMDQQSTVIYGDPAAIEKIENLNVELDLSTITSNTTLMQPVSLPSGVTSSDISVVNLKVVLDSATEKQIKDVIITYRNNDNGLGALDIDATKVDVTIVGTASSIENVTADNITAYIDVADLGPGTYKLPIHLEKKNTSAYFNMASNLPEINITLVKEG